MIRAPLIRWRVSARRSHSWDQSTCSCASCNQPCEIGRYRWQWLARAHAWLHNRTGSSPHAFIERLAIATGSVPEVMRPTGALEFELVDGIFEFSPADQELTDGP